MKAKKDKSPHDVIEGMLLHLIETRVRSYPFIDVVSKKQLWFGNGKFKDADDSDFRNGLRQFLGVKIPSDAEVERKSIFYGYPALIKPWSFLNNITNHAVRQRVLWRVINGGELSDIRPILGQGYITKDNKLDPRQTTGISCYVFFLADPEYRQQQNQWIENQPDWVRWQILRNQQTHRSLLTSKKKQASTLVKNNNKLLQLQEYLELDPKVDRKQIPWKEEE